MIHCAAFGHTSSSSGTAGHLGSHQRAGHPAYDRRRPIGRRAPFHSHRQRSSPIGTKAVGSLKKPRRSELRQGLRPNGSASVAPGVVATRLAPYSVDAFFGDDRNHHQPRHRIGPPPAKQRHSEASRPTGSPTNKCKNRLVWNRRSSPRFRFRQQPGASLVPTTASPPRRRRRR